MNGAFGNFPIGDHHYLTCSVCVCVCVYVPCIEFSGSQKQISYGDSIYETPGVRYRLLAEGTHVPSLLHVMRTRTLLLLLEFQGHLVIGLGKPVLTLVQKTL